jgi:hypothetical protein
MLAPGEATAQALALRVGAICLGFLVGFVAAGRGAAVADLRLLSAALRRAAVSRPA